MQAPSEIVYRFLPGADGTIGSVATRYGTSPAAIYSYNRSHHERRDEFSGEHQFLVLIDQGMTVLLPTPHSEREVEWETVRNTTANISLREFCDAQNRRRRGQPHVDAEVLWTYAVNASLRDVVLRPVENTSESTAWDNDPRMARLPLDAEVWLPYVPLMIGPPVAARPDGTATLAPPPGWLPAFEEKIRLVGVRTGSLRAANAEVQYTKDECAKAAAIIHFLEDLFVALHSNRQQTGRATANAVDPFAAPIATLRAQIEEHMLANPSRYYGTDDLTQRENRAAELVTVLSDAQLDEWLDILQRDHADLRGGARTLLHAHQVLEAAHHALARSQTRAAVGYLGRCSPGLDPPPAGASPQATGFPILTALTFLGSLTATTVGNVPGPASLTVAVAQYDMFRQVLAAGGPQIKSQAVARSARALIQGARLTGESATRVEYLIRYARDIHDPMPAGASERPRLPARVAAERAARALRGDVQGGPGFTGLLFFCSALSLYSSFADGVGPQALSGWLSAGSAAAGTVVAGSQLVTQLFLDLEANGRAAQILSRAGETMGNFAALLSLASAVCSIHDWFDTDPLDRSGIQLASLLMQVAGSALTLYAFLAEVPGLQIWGLAIAAAASIVGNWEALTTTAMKRLVLQQIRYFRDGNNDNDEHDQPVDPTFRRRMANPVHGSDGAVISPSMYRLVLNGGAPASLSSACDALYAAINSWDGEQFLSDYRYPASTGIAGELRDKVHLDADAAAAIITVHERFNPDTSPPRALGHNY